MKRLGLCLLLVAMVVSSALAGMKSTDRVDPAKRAMFGGDPTAAVVTSLGNALVVVQTDEVGDFNIGTADGRSLLYFYPGEPVTSDIRIMIDGLVYNLSNDVGTACNGTAAFVSWNNDGVSIHTYFTLGTIGIEVRHTPVMFSGTTAAILTETFVHNNDGAAHNIGVVYQYDTTVDGDDAAELFHGANQALVETCYDAPYNTNYWDAIPVSGLLVGRGTFTGGDAVTPDHLAYGSWPTYWGTCANRVCDGSPYGDSSVLYQWDEDPVPSDGSRRVATYYGVGELQIAPGDLQLSTSIPPVICTPNGISPNPVEVLVNVTNTGGSSCENLVVTLIGGAGPGGTGTITSANPQVIPFLGAGNNDAVSFTVQLTPTVGGGCINFVATVSSANCPANTIEFCVEVPACDPCTPTSALFDALTDVGESQCIELCPNQSSRIRVIHLAPGQYPVVTKRLGCRNEYCQTDCDASDYIQEFFGGQWQYTNGVFWLEIRGNGCICVTLDDVLPVELNSFSAVAENGMISLAWSTASESNLDRFELVRNGSTIASITAQNASAGAQYTWSDENVQSGTLYTYDLVAVSLDGSRETLATRSATPQGDVAVISTYALHQNYPNPFNPETNIAFDLAEAGHVELTVINVSGQEIASLASGYFAAGRHQVSFNGANLASGVYMYQLKVNGFTATEKMILMK
ncbi:MAG: T9SS type A sorting domain-containing protein [bacterium]|nr:T9SS type A sorting domain-containing protein [bacterium]